jgi:eukaryotic-like serine/threonine-protein kinase
VLIDEEGSAKVTDFGIARTLDEEGLTADGRVLGTTDYVSPEQALGQPVTGQSDLYSLGIVLYEMTTGEVPFKGENQVAVAMKHVREEIPDVQVRRPEVSSALAAVIDTATAKRREDRYADDAELIADLEDVLAIETARAGGATGEATSVLRTLPSRARRRIPFRMRHRVAAVALLLIVTAAAVAGVVWLATRAHHGTGNLNVKAPSSGSSTSTPLKQVRLCQGCAFGFNPLGTPSNEHPDASLAIDNQLGTAWTTQTYYSGALNKAGVGLYVDARPMTAARVLRIFTTTPGFTATIYARKDQPPLSWPDSGWTKISAATVVSHRQDIRLTSSSTKYRFYLVWITSLAGHPSLALDEVTLYR